MWPFGDGKPASTTEIGAEGVSTSQHVTPVTTEAAPTSRALRNQQADQEFAELIKSFQSPEPAQTTTIPVAPTPAVGGIVPPVTKPAETRSTYEPEVYEDGTIDIRAEVMYPRSMNCRQAFDQAFYCQSFGGKFNDIYRYGHLRSCSEQWNAFWFCMRTRTLHDDAKAAQTMEFYKDRDAKRRKEVKNSEDVWDIRTRSVERAFWKDPEVENQQEAIKE